ncbi:tetraspanin-9-like [Corticium candelabrum]|uniref:tetraspanin-9-like n=1 Tax=Corticium candelabrum TaxID=121492 RepID=UPI002E26F4C8|nr:tetraspanin-9-like [Corticium candelabrum]
MGESKLSGGMACVKWLLLIFNLIFWAGGVAILGVGIYVKLKFGDFVDILDKDWANAPNLLIAVGAIIAVLAFFGCIGAWCESRCSLYVFAILLFVTFVLELVAGILAVVYRDDVKDKLQGLLTTSQWEYDSEPVRKSWKAVQNEFDCCGVTNKTDWYGKGNFSSSNLPDSCCSNGAGCTASNSFDVGCYTKLVDWFDNNYMVVGAIVIVLALMQICGVICGCCLAKALGGD